jgi:hypothetical protein
MEYPQIHEWELASDAAERNPLADLPENPTPGTRWDGVGTDGVNRKWIAVRVVAGNHGGRWAYWRPWITDKGQNGVGEHPNFIAIADRIFNGDGSNFVGMFGVAYTGPNTYWILVDPKPEAPRVQWMVEPAPPAKSERYERSKEIYDVETGLSRDVRDPVTSRVEEESPSGAAGPQSLPVR